MKLEISTLKLQEAVSKAIKGASNNKLIPLTGLLSIEVNGGTLTLRTTDASNYLYIIEPDVSGEDFYATVDADMFVKLISKMTCPSLVIELKDNYLEVKGNGIYKIPLPLDENGQLIKFPDPIKDVNLDGAVSSVISSSVINLILNSIKPSLAVTMEVPCYTGYYMGNKVIATDTYKIAGVNEKLFDSPVLLGAQTFDLLSVMTAPSVEVKLVGNVVLFISNNCKIYGRLMDGLQDYQIDPITDLLESQYESMCKVAKNDLLQLLDRLSLFVNAYDKNGINLRFSKENLTVYSKSDNSVETIPYIESKSPVDFLCTIDIEMLSTQIKAYTGDVVELWYGQDNALKFVDGNLTQVVALLENEA